MVGTCISANNDASLSDGDNPFNVQLRRRLHKDGNCSSLDCTGQEDSKLDLQFHCELRSVQMYRSDKGHTNGCIEDDSAPSERSPRTTDKPRFPTYSPARAFYFQLRKPWPRVLSEKSIGVTIVIDRRGWYVPGPTCFFPLWLVSPVSHFRTHLTSYFSIWISFRKDTLQNW